GAAQSGAARRRRTAGGRLGGDRIAHAVEVEVVARGGRAVALRGDRRPRLRDRRVVGARLGRPAARIAEPTSRGEAGAATTARPRSVAPDHLSEVRVEWLDQVCDLPGPGRLAADGEVVQLRRAGRVARGEPVAAVRADGGWGGGAELRRPGGQLPVAAMGEPD